MPWLVLLWAFGVFLCGAAAGTFLPIRAVALERAESSWWHRAGAAMRERADASRTSRQQRKTAAAAEPVGKSVVAEPELKTSVAEVAPAVVAEAASSRLGDLSEVLRRPGEPDIYGDIDLDEDSGWRK